MREIKFRAWVKSESRYYNQEELELYSGGDIFDTKSGYWQLEQFTGLKDKNGVEGYECDIVKVPDNWDKFGWMAGEIREIYFFDGAFRLKPIEQGNGRGHLIEDGFNECEIIGNIHQNPELLK